MKFLLSTVLLLASGCLLYAQSGRSPDVASPAETCSVSGTVRRQDNGEPLNKARVTLSSPEKYADSLFDVTDVEGHFLLDHLPCHAYSLTVARQGFVNASYGQRRPSDPGAILALSPGQKASDLLFSLRRTAVISGHVFDEDGEPAQKAVVRLIRRASRGSPQGFYEAARADTDDRGEFRLFDLEPGRYYVVASYEPWSLQLGWDPLPQQNLRKKGYPVLFYPGTSDPSRAQTVVLNPGDELPALDFHMLLTPMNTVSGKLLNLAASGTGKNLNVHVSLAARGSGLSQFSVENLQNYSFDGNFVFYGVPPGSYYVQANSFDSDSKMPRWARREFDVTNADVEGVTLTFAPQVSIAGRVLWDAKSSADLPSLTAELIPVEEEGSGPGQHVSVKPDGFFVFRNVAEGEYHPRVLSSDNACYLKSARLGTVAMTDGRLAIRSGTDSSLEYTISCRVSLVEGRALTGDSLPVPGVYIVAVPEGRLRDVRWSYRETRTDQNGRFVLQGVPPGDYKLFSWDSIEEGDWLDPDFLKPYETKGVAVHLEESDHKTLDLTVIETSADIAPKS
jgi:hypothetical protein